jgi:orotidine-5'-phosphate decarboxylase
MSTETLFQAERGMILAADVADASELRRLADLAAPIPEVVAVKVGFSLALRYGLAPVVKALNDVSQLAVIYDHQKAATDIPEMGKPFAVVCRDSGVDAVIFFPHSGPRTLEAFVSAAVDQRLTPIVGLIMTHPAYLQSEGGFICDDAPGRICELAIQMGVRDFVLPGTKTDLVAAFASGPLSTVAPVRIMMPGIGTQGGSISAAFSAASPHHRFAIVGSTIYKAPDPQAAMRSLATEVRA